MLLHARGLLGAAALLAAATAAPAQGVVLAEEIHPGDASRFDITLAVAGKMKVERDGKRDSLPLTARAAHTFTEVVDAPDSQGGVGTAVRLYTAAGSESDLAGDRGKRTLPADRRLVVARRTADGTVHYTPAGPLTRDELELVAEHFDTLCLAALLPGKEVKPGETWAVGPEAAQHACLFEGLIKAELVGRLGEVKDGVAAFGIEGKAEGIEGGAHAKLTISAAGKFDVAAKRITDLVWEQFDDRDQGPASPASEVKAVVTLKRTPLAEAPAELAAAAARQKPTADGAVPEEVLALRYADPDGRYTFRYARDWHVVGRTKDHLVLRLLDKGEFACQATVSVWKKAEPGRHLSPAEFRDVVGKQPGWEPDGPPDEAALPAGPGRWLLRLVARGKQDGLPVVQVFYLLAGPAGDQVVVSVLAKADKAGKLGVHDAALVGAIEFPAGK